MPLEFALMSGDCELAFGKIMLLISREAKDQGPTCSSKLSRFVFSSIHG
jgi:hypothetical protein